MLTNSVWVFFILAWHWVFWFQGANFFSISIGKSVALLNCLRKWKPFLASCSNIIEPGTNFGSSVNEDMESQILVWYRVQVEGSCRTLNQKVWGVPTFRPGIVHALLKCARKSGRRNNFGFVATVIVMDNFMKFECKAPTKRLQNANATLLDTTCCLRFDHRVATYWILLALVWQWSNVSQQYPTGRDRV